MRPLEILIPIVLSIYLCWPLTGRKRSPALGMLPAFSLIMVVTHNRVEGMRWQMYPLYAFSALLFLTSLPAYLRAKGELMIQPRPTGRALAGLLLTLLLLAVSTMVPALLPVPSAPAPTGPYTVGTHTYALEDTSRKEIYSGKDEPRKLMLQIWYPAVPPELNAKPAPWMPDAAIIAPEIAEYLKLPSFFLDHLALAKSSAYDNLPVETKDGPYPVLVFVHGWNGFRQQSTFLMQELASHGYIVAALDLPYGARMVVFPDGSLAPNNPKALPPSANLPQDEYEATARILVDQWTHDIGYALDFLEDLNKNDTESQFSGRLDLSRVGVFGHSTGSGATIQFCSLDPRCKVGLTLDAFMRPVAIETLKNGTKQPFFYMFSELWPSDRNMELFEQYFSHTTPKNRVVTILGTDHYDFTDLPALSPLAPQLGLKGPLNGARVQTIVSDYVLAFFDLQLKNKSTDLFDGPSANYPEVQFDH